MDKKSFEDGLKLRNLVDDVRFCIKWMHTCNEKDYVNDCVNGAKMAIKQYFRLAKKYDILETEEVKVMKELYVHMLQERRDMFAVKKKVIE